MLKEIYIRNLAVIKEAVIPLNEKLNIFTGETGAGKSILINGINAVLGQRCTKDIVRTGCDKAEITALFTGLSEEVCKKLDELGISHDGGEITVTREVSADGGSVSRINQRTSPVSLLKEIGEMLINIHGQHDNQILLDSDRHLQILDDFGGDDTLLNEYRVTFRELQQTARRLGELKKLEQSRVERSIYLNGIIDDIGELELRESEDEELEREYEAAKNAEKTIIAIKSAVNAITGDETANDMIVSAETEIAGYTDNNQQLNTIYERLSAVEIELSDIALELEALAEDNYAVAVIGDGAMTGGMFYEAINNCGRDKRSNLIVILNDNNMSISKSVGSLSKYLTSLRNTEKYLNTKRAVERGLGKIPLVGNSVAKGIKNVKDSVKSNILEQSTMFEDLGFIYRNS